MPPQRILCVAEKPSIAKAVAQHLGGGAVRTTAVRGHTYVKNYEFDFRFTQWGHCSVTMTSVSGHLTSLDFADRYRKWETTPPGQLFEAETIIKIDPERKPIADNIQQQARYAKILFIWTDCDREGEHIGSEVREQARKGNSRITVKRARFSNTERTHVIQAAQNPIDLDDRQASAVATRIELDLRIGAAFTRLQTLQLKLLGDLLADKIISYGSCQFPTLGFVVDRYFRVKNFKPETFWSIKVVHVRDGVRVSFSWSRVHLFDRAIITIIFEKCLDAGLAKIIKVQKKPTSKWRPLPLTTVELQMQGSRFLRMDSKKVMKIAEQLYQRGWISYSRTETDQFPRDFNLRSLIEKQTRDNNWGAYAQGLLDEAFRQPRQGRNNDQAHPPIHPVNYVTPASLSDDERRVYEFVVRRFLACCSEDAKGEATDIDIEWGQEVFHTHGLLVLARNYLDVYVYDKWESSQQLPQFQMGETFEPTEANMTDGKTTAPGYLTEPELIGLMDANGIGTDATMADHVAMIKDRDYVAARPKAAGGRNSVQEFIPTRLGVALVEGYDNLGLEVSVSKPFLRKEIELKMKAICEGRKTKAEVVHESIEEYREVFGRTQRNIGILKRSVRKYVFGDDREYDPKPDKDKKDEKRSKKSSGEDAKLADSKSKEPGKSPPGFEQTFDKNNKSSPLSAPSGGSEPEKDATSEPYPGFAPMSDSEIEVLDAIARSVKNGLPQSQSQIIDKAIGIVKKGGVPIELREVMEANMKNPDKKLDLATAATLVRVLTKMSRMNVQQVRTHLEKEEKRKTKDEDEHEQEFKQSYSQKDNGRQQKGPDPSKFKIGDIKLDTGTFLVSAFLSYYLYRSLFPGESSRDITWQEFRTTFFDKGLVDKLTVINRNKVRVELHREAVANMYPESPAVRPNFYYYFTIGSVEAFERRLDEAHQELGIPSSERIPVAYSDEVPLSAALFSFGPTLLFVAALFWISRRAASGAGGQSGIFGIGKSRAKRFNHETDIKTKFSDVAGMDEAKLEIMEFVSFLKDPTKYQSLGAKIPRGAILSGPPGTGKTLLAKATAGESGVPFFSVSGSEFVEMFVGVGPSRVRDLFANARKNTPCIIFIDEIDAIGKSRGKGNFGGGNDERESTLNQILTEMDGFNTSEQVVVLAGTNRPDVLDKALLRPGRFDRHISIDRPTMDGRKQIFLVHLKKIVTSVDMEYLTGRLSALTPGFSGADIANCVNEAALIAARVNATAVEMKHFESAIERVIGGLEKKSLVLTPEEKKTVAYHEAGHAICGWFFKHADPLLKVSIIPRGQGALGYAQYLPAGGGDVYLMNVKQLMDRMAMTLGGRVSEELWFDTVTSGASDDFNKVTRLATAMVTEWGMSQKIGYLNYKDDEQRLHKPFSEETARNIDSEVRRIVDEAYRQCKDLLEEKKTQLQAVAEELLKKEMLVRDDLIRILGKRPFEDKGDFHKYFDNHEGKSAPPPPPTEGTEEEAGPGMPAPAFRRHG